MTFRAESLVCVILYTLTAIGSVQAHYPHDTYDFIELSPVFSVDSTAFITQKQGSSIRPHVALVTRDKGWSWNYNPAGMKNTSKFTSAATSPLYGSDATVFMTTAGEGVYRSVDGGLSWQTVNTGLPTNNLCNSATGLEPGGTITVFVVGTYGGIYRSLDSGASWATVLPSSVVISATAVSPNFSVDRIVLAGDPTGQLYKSVDGGTSFSLLVLLPGAGEITRIVFAPDFATSGEVFVGTTTGVFTSADSAESFSKIGSFGTKFVSALAVSPAYGTDATILAATPTEAVLKSTDGGATWTLHETGIPLVGQTNFHFTDIKLSDNFSVDNLVFLATFEGLFRSDDGGLTWTELETRPPTLIMDVALSPGFAQDGLVVASTYGGGLYVSDNAGTDWRVANIGVSNTYTYQVAVTEGLGADPILVASEQDFVLISEDKGVSWSRKQVTDVLPNACIPSAMDVSRTFAADGTILLGCRRDGVIATYDGGDTWQIMFSGTQLAGGSVASVKLSPEYATDSTVFFNDQRGIFLRSLDGGSAWALLSNGLPAFGTWFGGNSVVLSPGFAVDRVIAAATPQGVYSSTDAGDSWSPTADATSPVASGIIEALGYSPKYAQDMTILANVRGEGLFRTSNDGLSWEPAGAGLLENGYDLKKIVFSPNFAQDRMIIGFGHDRLVRSVDGGDSFHSIDIPFIRHEDSRKQSVVFGSGWLMGSGARISATTFRASATNGAQARISFFGTGVSWIGARAEFLGYAHVFLNRSYIGTVDQYGPATQLGQTLISVQGLPLGQHELHIVSSDQKNTNATSNWTVIDAFDVRR